MRRAPVYLLIDTSGSMSGEPIIAVQNGIKTCIDTLRSDPESLEKAHVSIIAFSDTASVVMPLTSIQEFPAVPDFTVHGCTSYVAALNKLNELLEQDIVPNRGEEKGDYRAFVMVFTDGMPTDKESDLQEAISRLNRKKMTYFVAGTTSSDERVIPTLSKITGNNDYVIFLSSADPRSFQRFFQWVSQSASRSIGVQGDRRPGDDIPLGELPPLPNFNPDDDVFL